MNNDLIRRGDVERMICAGLNNRAYGYDAVCILSALREIPAAPQPMSAVEYARSFARMCRSHTCGKCPFHESEKFSAASCVKFEGEYPEEAVAIVQKWAQEHPEGSVEDA